MRWFRSLLLFCVCVSLSACVGIWPLGEKEPTALSLQVVTPTGSALPAASLTRPPLSLVVERPSAPSGLSGHSIWFASGPHQLTPFREHQWQTPLPEQLETYLQAYLSQSLPGVRVYLDRPGVSSDYRLTSELLQWHLDQTSQRLLVTLHAHLYQGERLLISWQWQHSEALREVTAPGLVQAGQVWMEKWFQQLERSLWPYLIPLE